MIYFLKKIFLKHFLLSHNFIWFSNEFHIDSDDFYAKLSTNVPKLIGGSF